MIRGTITVKTRMGKYREEAKEFASDKHLSNYINKTNSSGAKVIGWHPEFPVKVISNLGEITLSEMGRVTNFEEYPGGEDGLTMNKYLNELRGIRFFNVSELRNWLKDKTGSLKIPKRIDIVDIGYWTKEYEYVAPEMSHREKTYISKF